MLQQQYNFKAFECNLAQGSFERTDLQKFNYPWTALEGGRKKMKLELIDA